MRQTIIPTLLLLTFSVFGQTAIKDFTVIGRNDSLKIEAIKRSDNSKYFLLIKTKTKTDSLLLNKDDNHWGTDTCIISARQLDGKGRPEIITKQIKANQEGAPGINSSTTIQIWNPDTKTKLFDANTNWHFEVYVLSEEHLDNNYEPTMIDCLCTGSYEIEFTDSGQIIIKNLFVKSENTPYCKPDNNEGTYTLTNGKYILTKEK